MAVTQREFSQVLWTRPGINFFLAPGDFYDLSGLMPTPDRQAIQRGPSWGAIQALPAGIDDLETITYLEADDEWLLVGNDATNLVAVSTSNLTSFGAVQTLLASVAAYGGLHGRNILHWAGDIWFITTAQDIYRGVWDSTPASLYSTTNVIILFPAKDRMYAVDETGKVLQLNDANDGMETFWTPTDSIDVIHAAVLGPNFFLFCQRDGSQLEILKLPDYMTSGVTVRAHQVALLEGNSLNTEDNLFCTYQGAIYFTTGRKDNDTLLVYKLTGAGAEFVTTLDASSASGGRRSAPGWPPGGSGAGCSRQACPFRHGGSALAAVRDAGRLPPAPPLSPAALALRRCWGGHQPVSLRISRVSLRYNQFGIIWDIMWYISRNSDT